MSATITLLAGSRSGARPEYAEGTSEIVRHLVRAGHCIRYGGGSTGLMGVIAETTLAEGGEIEGVMPRFLAAGEALHRRLTTTILVDTMADRKRRLFAGVDAIVVLPGGIGTLEEFFDAYSQLLLGQSSTPIVVYDVAHYWYRLRTLLAASVAAEFLSGEELPCIEFADEPNEVGSLIRTWRPPPSRTALRAKVDSVDPLMPRPVAN